MTAKALARTGITVYAGCLTDDGCQALQALARQEILSIHAWKLDVTDQESVQTFATNVHGATPEGIGTLINNAGVVRMGVLDMAPVSDFEKQLDINTVGVYRITQALLPALRLGRGRVICIASICGRISAASTGAYCASKFAVEALADAWRQELQMWGIDVVLVEPGAMLTPFFDGLFDEAAAERAWNGLSSEIKALYGPEWLPRQTKQQSKVG